MYNLIIERVFLNVIIFLSLLQKRFILFFHLTLITINLYVLKKCYYTTIILLNLVKL